MSCAAIYPGTFDPVTNGHIDLIRRSLSLFDRLVLAIARNPQKAPLFDADERLEIAREALAGIDGVEIVVFDRLLIELAREMKCRVIVRGLRAITDFEYEMQIALTNRTLDPSLETLFLIPHKNNIYLSSRIVKEIASYGGAVSEFVPAPVERRLREKFPPKK